MGNDLVERLRKGCILAQDGLGGVNMKVTDELCNEAADRIEAMEEALKPIAELFADAQGRLTPDYGEVTGRDFQMMTMHPDPEGLAADLRRAARAYNSEEPGNPEKPDASSG